MVSSRLYLERHGLEPHDLPIVGAFEPQYLLLRVAFASTLWQAITEWLRAYGGKPPPLDISDPYDRMTAQALIVREHELAHFYAFLTNPFASTIQCLGLMRDMHVFLMARTLHNAGQSQLRIPLNRWRDNYELDHVTTSQLEKVEARIRGYAAISGMLMYGLRGVSLPTSLRDDQSNSTFWPWLLICEDIQRSNIEMGGITFRDLHEGFAVISESRAMAHVGVSMEQFLQLRRGLYDEYAVVPATVSQAFGGWHEMTAGIVTSAAIVLPAVAVLKGADDWPRFDASACLYRVLAAARPLGTVLNHVRAEKPLKDYVKSIFEHSYPGFEPASLLHQDSRARIEAAFGVDKLKNLEGVKGLLPSLSWLERAQSEIDVEISWEQRFLPVPLGKDKWWPAVIWFRDSLSNHTDLDTYESIRNSFINHRLADALFYQGDLSDVEDVCFGGTTGPGTNLEGPAEVLAYFVDAATSFALKDVCGDAR